MSEENEDSSAGFKVKDKRRFDSDGNVRDGEEGGKATPSPVEGEDFVMQDSSAAAATSADASEYSSETIDFASFVLSLGTQALMQLGVMPSPDGVEIPQNREAAKQTIDIIGMLEEKTSGNLNDTEARLMKEMLHNLRMSYVAGK